MKIIDDSTAKDRLYLKALAVRYERQVGLWRPIMWHLALRGHAGAMIELADWFSEAAKTSSVGKPADSFAAADLYRRAYLKGDPRAARNAAMGCFNRNDMPGYRMWLRRAANAGDADSRRELRRFETRLWHGAARKIGRLRPWHKRDDYQ